MIFARLFVEGPSLMLDVGRGQEFSGRDGLDGFADKNSVHDNAVADVEAARGEFVFGGNILGKSVGLPLEFDGFRPGSRLVRAIKNVVARIELEKGARHEREVTV